jgi:hypothetical protein
MNSNPMSPQYGQIKKWDELTKEEQESGDWFKLPDGVRWTNDKNTLDLAVALDEKQKEQDAEFERALDELLAKTEEITK